MPVQVDFDTKNHIVLQTYTDPLSSPEINGLRDKMTREILPSTGEKIHVIADFRGVKSLPGTILSTGMGMLRSAHPNTGLIVAVTKSAFVNAMARVFRDLVSNHSFVVVTSLEAAHAEIDAFIQKEH
jgi:hypothetical protein